MSYIEKLKETLTAGFKSVVGTPNVTEDVSAEYKASFKYWDSLPAGDEKDRAWKVMYDLETATLSQEFKVMT